MSYSHKHHHLSIHGRTAVVAGLSVALLLLIVPATYLTAQLQDQTSNSCSLSADCEVDQICSVELGECTQSQRCTENGLCVSICTGSCVSRRSVNLPCKSDVECGAGFVCEEDPTSCGPDPSCQPGAPCLTVCQGVCKEPSVIPIEEVEPVEEIPPFEEEDDGFLQLTSTLDIAQSYVARQPCLPGQVAGCGDNLWFQVTQSNGLPIRRSDETAFSLKGWSIFLQNYELLPAVPSIVYQANGDLTGLSFPIAKPLPDEIFPHTAYYVMQALVNQEVSAWTAEVNYKTLAGTPTVFISEANEVYPPREVPKQDPAEPEEVPDPVEEEVIDISFRDLPPGLPITDAALRLAVRGIISGYPDGTFKPIRFVNRAEAAKFLLTSAYGDIPNVPHDGRFSDVEDGQWYVKYIMYAAELGIIKGYSDGTFRPGDTVNTAEFLKMATLTFQLDENLPFPYIDVENSDWFASYAGAGSLYKLFPKRVDYQLFPQMKMTREEVALAIDILVERVVGK